MAALYLLITSMTSTLSLLFGAKLHRPVRLEHNSAHVMIASQERGSFQKEKAQQLTCIIRSNSGCMLCT